MTVWLSSRMVGSVMLGASLWLVAVIAAVVIVVVPVLAHG